MRQRSVVVALIVSACATATARGPASAPAPQPPPPERAVIHVESTFTNEPAPKDPAKEAEELAQRRKRASTLTLDQLEALDQATLLPEEQRRLKKLRADKERQEKKQRAEEEKKRRALAKRLRGATEITAMQLLAAYHTNEVAADAQYRGRRVAVTGFVVSIDKSIFDMAFIHIGSGDPDEQFFTVSCMLGRKVQRDVASLVPGQQVTVLGRVTGMTMGSPTLDECSLFMYWSR
jgi:hypothetical protein